MGTYRKRGKKWYAETYLHGERKGRTFNTKSEAREWAENPLPEINLHALAEKYLREVAPYHKGYRQEILRLRRVVRDLPDIPVTNLTKDTFAAWKYELSQTVKPGTVRRYMTLLNAMFNHAVNEWGYLNTNPLKTIKKPPDKRRDRVPTEKEIVTILAKLGYSGPVETIQHEIAVSLLIALETAMRAGEILSICPENTKGRVVTLVDTKNRDKREVPLSTEAVRLIELLPGNKFTVSSAVHSSLFSRAVKDSGIEDLRFHDSRALGLMRLSKKVDVLMLARIVGHRSPTSLMIYYRESAADIARLLD